MNLPSVLKHTHIHKRMNTQSIKQHDARAEQEQCFNESTVNLLSHCSVLLFMRHFYHSLLQMDWKLEELNLIASHFYFNTFTQQEHIKGND